jgi:hypothetical protein
MGAGDSCRNWRQARMQLHVVVAIQMSELQAEAMALLNLCFPFSPYLVQSDATGS